MSRILVADDNAASRALVRAVLRNEQVLEAVNGQDALDAIARERPDLVLLDIDMPVLDGYAVVKRLRADPQYRALPVIAVTAYAMTGDREKALAAGFSAYVPKPIRAAVLREQIAALLNAGARTGAGEGE